MNKQDLVKELSERLSITQRKSTLFLDCLSQITTESLQRDEALKLPGIGRISPRLQTTRPGRNPRTGIFCPIPERQCVRFRASKYLIDALNGIENDKTIDE